MITTEILNLVALAWIGMAILIFPVLLRVTAPYGRHTTQRWGPMISNRLGWFLMEFPALAVFGYFMLAGGRLNEQIILIAFVLWEMHYINRTIIFPLRIKTSRKKMPLAIAGMAVFFNFINGFINGYWLGLLAPAYPESWITDPRFIAGILLFFLGFSINLFHDNLLIKLRKNNGSSYKIPEGGLFRYISCPNFFGEMLEWGGFALMTWCLPSLSFFVWTVVNLLPRALDHHRWYKSKFEDYPAERKAVIPFVL